MRIRFVVLSAIAALGLCLTAHADDTYVINGTITGVTYTTMSGFFPSPGTTNEVLTVSLPTTLSNVDLSSYSGVSLVLSTLNGETVNVSENSTFEMSLSYFAPNYTGNSNPSDPSFTYTGTGPAPTVLYQNDTINADGTWIAATVEVSMFAGDSFSQLDFGFNTSGITVPSTLNYTLTDNVNPNIFVSGTQPSFVTLDSNVSATPEPSSFALLGTGLFAGGAFLRRKLARA